MSEVLSATNLKFLAQGMWTTLYLSFFIIVLSTLFGTILAVMRNGKNPIHFSGLGGNHSWGTELYRPWPNGSRLVSRV